MIIVRIANGLGNQMFQYALGRALSAKNNTELVLDISSFDNQKKGEAKRHYTLNNFNVKERFSTPADFKSTGIPNPGNNGFIAKICRKLIKSREERKPINERSIVVEPTADFIPDILKINHDCLLVGVWQSPKYFENIKNELKKEFTLKNPLSASGAKLKTLIDSCESVAIHVRRGDQIHNPHLAKKHGVLNEDYYQTSANYIKARVQHPHFFVFSDEPEWVKNNFDLGDNVTYVDDFKLPDFEELILMGSCKHTVVAKSSYSWWGAWLNTNPKAIIITPKHRYGDPNANDKDLIPESWVRI